MIRARPAVERSDVSLPGTPMPRLLPPPTTSSLRPDAAQSATASRMSRASLGCIAASVVILKTAEDRDAKPDRDARACGRVLRSDEGWETPCPGSSGRQDQRRTSRAAAVADPAH